MEATMKVGIIGAGRIGRVHAQNISVYLPELEIKTIADPFMDDGLKSFAKRLGVPNCVKDADEIFNDEEIEAVLICSSTDTHSAYIIQAARAGKHIFCEKPIDYDLNRVREAIQAAEDAGVKLQIGFCRRFDHNHRAVYELVRTGKVGIPQMVKISSRDPSPPPVEYVRVSGGIFYDMMIHDFDMARFLMGSEVVEVYAQGSVLIDPAIGEAGDVDTAMVTLKFENGALGYIDNSRQAVYGYDQRVEVFGSAGCAQNENDLPNTASLHTLQGTFCEPTYEIMFERYTFAFVNEIRAFSDAILGDKETPVTGMDGLYPVQMAAAAAKSLKEGRPVKISEVG